MKVEKRWTRPRGQLLLFVDFGPVFGARSRFVADRSPKRFSINVTNVVSCARLRRTCCHCVGNMAAPHFSLGIVRKGVLRVFCVPFWSGLLSMLIYSACRSSGQNHNSQSKPICEFLIGPEDKHFEVCECATATTFRRCTRSSCEQIPLFRRGKEHPGMDPRDVHGVSWRVLAAL